MSPLIFRDLPQWVSASCAVPKLTLPGLVLMKLPLARRKKVGVGRWEKVEKTCILLASYLYYLYLSNPFNVIDVDYFTP